MADPVLVVPVALDAVVVNAAIESDDVFRWWTMDYAVLAKFKSPEPTAFDRFVEAQDPGIYLHWVVPSALRRGVRDQLTGQIDYPLVPNRWLVVRTSGNESRSAIGWVIESDCPATSPAAGWAASGQSSQYVPDDATIAVWNASPDSYRSQTGLAAGATTLQRTMLGLAFPLAGDASLEPPLPPWQERDAYSMFLTAMGPANPYFAIYYPHNVGVFGMYDALAGVPAGSVSYSVVGWYSDSRKDPLVATGEAYAQVLQRLDWVVAGDPPEQPARSAYQGFALGLGWDPSSAASRPPGDPLDAAKHSPHVDVAIGNTAIDAFTALLTNDLAVTTAVPLLRALMYDLLPTLEQPNGDAILARAIRDGWFGSSHGGTRWSIVAADSGGSVDVSLDADESEWLATLNTHQAKLDAAACTLAHWQWRLNALWWARGRLPAESILGPPPGAPTDAEMATQLDPLTAGGVAAQTLVALADVQALMAKVPQPASDPTLDPQKRLMAGINSFVSGSPLADGHILKAITDDRYWQANDPVLVISGVEPPKESRRAGSLAVRTSSQLATAVEVPGGSAIGASAAAGLLASLAGRDGLPDLTAALLTEFVLLDAGNAKLLAAATAQTEAAVQTDLSAHDPVDYPAAVLPALGLEPWTQPWEPMFMEWQVGMTQVDDPSCWWFDGTDYRYAPAGMPAVSTWNVSGISLLAPQTQTIFESRLDRFLAHHTRPDDDGLAQLRTEVASVEQWRFLAQALTGFGRQLTRRDTRAFRRPGPADAVGTGPDARPLAPLAGYADAVPATQQPGPSVGRVTSVPLVAPGSIPDFRGVRQGQAYLKKLSLYDKFGRVLDLVSDGTDAGVHDAAVFPLKRDTPMIPSTQIDGSVAAPFELPPRLLQEARLDFDLVDATHDDSLVGSDPAANPICGWILANHLDASLLVFAPDGTALGEYRLFTAADGSRSGKWTAPPHSAVQGLDDVARQAPRLAQLLRSSQLADQAALEAFLQVIDTTLWTTDPLGARADQDLSVLIGRPLALVRGGLSIALAGPALCDVSWPATIDPPLPSFLSQSFSIRLGDLATRDDGLIGYYLDGNFDVFHSVPVPEQDAVQEYVTPIGPLGQREGANYITLEPRNHSAADVTMLVDPRGAIQATTGVFPVTRVQVPAGLVEQALERLEVGFRVAPVLTTVAPAPAQGDSPRDPPSAVRLPVPTERGGSWSWWQQSASGWTQYGMIPATSDALLESVPVQAWDGVLQFVADLDDAARGEAK